MTRVTNVAISDRHAGSIDRNVIRGADEPPPV